MNRIGSIRWGMWAVAAALVLVASAAAVRLWLLEGWLRTIRIDGASMAETLCGKHLLATCTDCGIEFKCDAEHLPESGRLVCPNCGFRELNAGAFPVHPGDTVLVDRWPLLAAGPRREDLVAYDDPIAGGLAVKRIAGLPGEKLSIRGGDLYADGNLVRKSLAEFNQVAVLVHDNDHLPRSLPGGPDAGQASRPEFLRWKPRTAATQWQAIPGGFEYRPEGTARLDAPDWLEYLHWRCDASLTPRGEPAAILDNDAYNQAQARRLNEVTDLVLSCRAHLGEQSVLTLALETAGRRLEVVLDATGNRLTPLVDGDELPAQSRPIDLTGSTATIEWGYLDGRLVAAIDGHTLVAAPVAARPSDSDGKRGAARLSIAASSGTVSIARLRVWRDLFLLEPHGTQRDWEMSAPLGADEFLVLGDNPPVSIDGRHHQPGGLPRARLRGHVLMPHRRR